MQRIRAIGLRVRRIIVHFHEDSIDPGGDCGAR